MTHDHCPTCGAKVTVVSGDEGTSHYEPVGGHDQGSEETMNADVEPAQLAAMRLWDAASDEQRYWLMEGQRCQAFAARAERDEAAASIESLQAEIKRLTQCGECGGSGLTYYRTGEDAVGRHTCSTCLGRGTVATPQPPTEGETT